MLHGEPSREAVALLLPAAGTDVPQASGRALLIRAPAEPLLHRVERHPPSQSRLQHLRHDVLAC